jgi:hypothetical protein
VEERLVSVMEQRVGFRFNTSAYRISATSVEYQHMVNEIAKSG